MMAETRIVLVKPGDVLIFGNVGTLDVERAISAASTLKEHLGLAEVVMFAEDIDLAVIDGKDA